MLKMKRMKDCEIGNKDNISKKILFIEGRKVRYTKRMRMLWKEEEQAKNRNHETDLKPS